MGNAHKGFSQPLNGDGNTADTLRRRRRSLWGPADGGEKKKMPTTGCVPSGRKHGNYATTTQRPPTDPIPHFSNTQNNQHEVFANYKTLTVHTEFSGYSKQGSTARLCKPFSKKISSFISYEQDERVPSQELAHRSPVTAECAGDARTQLSSAASLLLSTHLLYGSSNDWDS